MDSGLSLHLTPKKEYFFLYTFNDYGYVRIGNDGSYKIVGMGNVCSMTSTDCKIILRDVRYVPNVKLNLICLR